MSKEERRPMDLKFKWNRMESFSALEMYNIIQAREAVFVVEQACAYQEADGADTQSWHLSVLLDGELAAYARVVDPGVKYCEPSIGRVMAVAQYRKLQIGRALVTEAIAFAEAKFPGTGIRIGAQAHLHKFYGSLGFLPVGEIYDEDGIPHIEMLKPPVAVAQN
jgi:ElaA protein